MTFPEPVIEVAIEPKTKADQEKLGLAIQKLAEEDPTFRTEQNPETGQTIIKGMGELHLDILVDRMKREFNVEANVGKPQVAYRETISRKVEKHDYTHKKQTGGSGQFAKVQISLEPSRSRGEDLRVREQGHGWSRPARVHPVGGPRNPGRHARRRARRLPDGGRQGDPARWCVPRRRLLGDGVQDCRLMAFKEAARKAQPVLLEPLMAVEVRTPEEYMGDVIGDLNSRRGQIQSMEDATGVKVVRAHVPLSEMFGYVGDLRSKTSGRAVYSMTFESYAEGPEGCRRDRPEEQGRVDQATADRDARRRPSNITTHQSVCIRNHRMRTVLRRTHSG